MPPAQAVPAGPEDILHERLARGDIDIDGYQRRLEVLQATRRV